MEPVFLYNSSSIWCLVCTWAVCQNYMKLQQLALSQGPFPDHFLWFYGCKWGSHSINGLTYWLTTEATTVPYKQLTNEEVWLWSFANWHQLQPSPLGTYRGVSWAPTQGCQNIWVLKPAGKSRGDMSWGWVLFRTKTMWDSLNAINHP